MRFQKVGTLFLVLALTLSMAAPVFAGGTAACTVKVAIAGPGGELVYGSHSVVVKEDNPRGITVLGALEATGVDYDGTDYGAMGFLVESIGGQQAVYPAGWLYTVNDIAGSVGASSCPLAEGDQVLWYYSTSYEAPAPEWSDLQDQLPPDPGEPIDLKKALKGIVSFYRAHHTALDNWEEVLALWGAGVDLSAAPWQMPSWKIGQLGDESAVTAYATTVLGMIAAGEDPAAAGGRNLAAELAARQNADGSFGEGWLNEHIWSLIALDTAGQAYDRGRAVVFLLKQQLTGGGFTLFGDEADPDMTAMALIALSAHRGEAGVAEAVRAALNCLQGLQQPGGGFAAWGSESAESAAAVIRALVACGEDPAAAPWTGGGRSIIHALFAYQLPDGSFKFGDESNPMTTCQALLAVGDLVHGSIFERLAAAYEPGAGPERSSQSGSGALCSGEEEEDTDLPQTAGGGRAPWPGPALIGLGFLFVLRNRWRHLTVRR